jgi:lipopolysaccharide transport system ATP-binding protein
MSSNVAISARGLGKQFSMYPSPVHRLKEILHWPGAREGTLRHHHHALRDVSFDVARGEVLGLVGRNGAGKSTLLQLVCGTLTPSSGQVLVNGRVSALLELGAGFNPEFTGRENAVLNGALHGLSRDEMSSRMDEIVAFADIGEFIEQPVKTYSSGMFMRLAFAVATSVEPDILIIDEALSVGDGQFARKSFDRIMALKDAGKTILFCSHSMHHIESICNRALWLEKGQVRMLDRPAPTVAAYNTFLALMENQQLAPHAEAPPDAAAADKRITDKAKILKIKVAVDDCVGQVLSAQSLQSDLRIDVEFAIPGGMLPPSVAVGLVARSGHVIASAGSHNDGVGFEVAADGTGRGSIVFPKIALLKGEYIVRVFLMCERGIHIYEHVDTAAELIVSQHGLEQGFVTLPHHWPGAKPSPETGREGLK